jgi:hypothetical protein
MCGQRSGGLLEREVLVASRESRRPPLSSVATDVTVNHRDARLTSSA